MEYLYAPWRGTYSKEAQEQTHLRSGCPFCNHLVSHDDIKNYILKRYQHCAVLLNAYPYNPGHLLIIPHAHVANLHDLTPEARAEIMDATAEAVYILEQALHNDGTNVGLNIGGSSAGGSIPEHLHIHIVPRWPGDTNFLPVLAQTKQLSEDLNVVYKKLKPAFEQ
jgi:ATP adenylyltransferase